MSKGISGTTREDDLVPSLLRDAVADRGATTEELTLQRAKTGSGARDWTIIVLTCRQAHTDFRLPLARALANLGHAVHYVFLKRRPVVQVMNSDGAPEEMSIVALVRYLRALSLSAERTIIFNSTNLVFPGLISLLKLSVPGIWCLDLHDDLLYELKGWRRKRAKVSQALLRFASHLSVHSAPTLSELFPGSHHLGNASNIPFIVRNEFDAKNILVLASVDGRFDFEFMRHVLRGNPKKHFHVHGQISKANTETSTKLQELTSSSTNFTYHGPYSNQDLPALLARYSVTLAPYIVNARLTRYIDPLRFYHCLNSGMEVISTDIPAARALEDVLFVVESPDSFTSLADRLARDKMARKNVGSTSRFYNWQVKARLLVSIVEDVYRTR